jgi:serine/threonine protein kinase
LNGSLSFKTDIWGFGCVLLQFATGLRPFNDIDHEVAASMKIF